MHSTCSTQASCSGTETARELRLPEGCRQGFAAHYVCMYSPASFFQAWKRKLLGCRSSLVCQSAPTQVFGYFSNSCKHTSQGISVPVLYIPPTSFLKVSSTLTCCPSPLICKSEHFQLQDVIILTNCFFMFMMGFIGNLLWVVHVPQAKEIPELHG